MCTILAAALTASAMGTGLTAYSQYQQGQFAKGMAGRQAQVEDMKTRAAYEQGAVAEQQTRERTAQAMGAQRAAMGASGTVLNSGTNADILADTAKFGELDAQTARTNALKQAWGYQVDAGTAGAQGFMAAKAGEMNAMGTLLGGGAQAYGLWKRR